MTDDRNEAERMRDAYAERQEREQETGITSAGAAGSTATPGNQEAGAAVPDDDQEQSPPPIPDDQHTPGR